MNVSTFRIRKINTPPAIEFYIFKILFCKTAVLQNFLRNVNSYKYDWLTATPSFSPILTMDPSYAKSRNTLTLSS